MRAFLLGGWARACSGDRDLDSYPVNIANGDATLDIADLIKLQQLLLEQ